MRKILLMVLFLFIPIDVTAVNLPETYSEAVIIYDLTSEEVLIEKNSENIAKIASLTKIMTTITAIEKIDDLKETVTLDERTFLGLPMDASVAHLKVGDVVTYEDLLYASILPSGADATQALAVNLSGSISGFVNEMNALASKIGMNNSHFVNVTGLDIENHFSSAQDIVKLLKYALKNDTFKKVYTTKKYTLMNGLEVSSSVGAYNKALNLDLSRILGSKTGFTDEAGLCISVLFESDGHEFIMVTLGAQKIINTRGHLIDAMNLISFVDDNYNNQVLVPKGKVIKKYQ